MISFWKTNAIKLNFGRGGFCRRGVLSGQENYDDKRKTFSQKDERPKRKRIKLLNTRVFFTLELGLSLFTIEENFPYLTIWPFLHQTEVYIVPKMWVRSLRKCYLWVTFNFLCFHCTLWQQESFLIHEADLFSHCVCTSVRSSVLRYISLHFSNSIRKTKNSQVRIVIATSWTTVDLAEGIIYDTNDFYHCVSTTVKVELKRKKDRCCCWFIWSRNLGPK